MENSAQYRTDFIKTVEKITSYKDHYTVFRDFLEASFCAIAKTSLIGNHEEANKLEARYMKVVQSYEDKDDFRQFSKLLGLTAMSLTSLDCDFLGEVAGEIGALSKWKGQFFTPFSLSQLIAQINFPPKKVANWVDQRGYCTVSEPAVGAGGMILALARTLRDQGHNPEKMCFVEAWDVSETAFQMAYIQLSLAGIPAKLVWGDTLRMKVSASYLTPITHLFALRHGYGPVYGDHRVPKKEISPREVKFRKDSPCTAPQQIALF